VSQYFLTKSGKTVGPCTLDDLRSYLAYGSVRDSDLTMRAGEEVWMPLRQLEELQLDQGTDSLQEITRRRRVVRYREYEKVPLKQRSGWILQEILLGFFFFPPKLWRASASVLQERIYRRGADQEGFLKYWPRWVETLVQILLIVNAIVWVVAVAYVATHALPIVRELVGLMKTGISDLQTFMSR
jgi:GYF domain 2